MTRIHVRGGTVDSEADLCRDCSMGMRMDGEKGIATMCNALDQPFRVHGKIHTCTRYQKRTTDPNIYSMQQVAWYKTRLKDGRETFCTSEGIQALKKLGFLFNEQEDNIRQLQKLYNLDGTEPIESTDDDDVVVGIR